MGLFHHGGSLASATSNPARTTIARESQAAGDVSTIGHQGCQGTASTKCVAFAKLVEGR